MSYRRMRPAYARGALTVNFANNYSARAVAKKMDRSQWALVFIGAVIGLTEYKESNWYRLANVALVVDYTNNGHYLKVKLLDRYTGAVGISERWVNASAYYRMYDSLAEYKLALQVEELTKKVEAAERSQRIQSQQDTAALSQNTVTRALVHADDHDYCTETIVALVSSGHKMPQVSLTFEVTAEVTITLDGADANDYYAVRRLFGSTRGDVQNATDVDFGYDHRERIEDRVREALCESDYDVTNTRHTGTDVEFPAPVIRPLSEVTNN